MKNIPTFESFVNELLNEAQKLDLKLSTNEYPSGTVNRFRIESDSINLRKVVNLAKETWSKNARPFTDTEIGFESASDRKAAMAAIQKSFDSGKNDIREFLIEGVNENVYPDKNGQLSSYDKKTFTEVGRRTVYLGKDLAAIFLFGYSVHDWKGTNEYVVNVTCTTYSTDVKNLGNSSGSIIYSEAFGTENDALMAAHDYLKNFKTK